MRADAATGVATLTDVRATRRRAIVVAGMHRCGTSAVTRVLSLLGARLPADLMQPATPDHPGFWEPLPIVRLHDDMLLSAGLTWSDVQRFPDTWYTSGAAADYRSRLVDLVVEEFGD